MPLKELLLRILERRATAEYIELLFTCMLERPAGLRLALGDLDESQRNDFVTAVFDYYSPASGPIAVQLWTMRDQLPDLRARIGSEFRRCATAIAAALADQENALTRAAETLDGPLRAALEQAARTTSQQAALEARKAQLTDLQGKFQDHLTELQALDQLNIRVAELRAQIAALHREPDGLLHKARMVMGPWHRATSELPRSLAEELRDVLLQMDETGKEGSLIARVEALRRKLKPYEQENPWQAPGSGRKDLT